MSTQTAPASNRVGIAVILAIVAAAAAAYFIVTSKSEPVAPSVPVAVSPSPAPAVSAKPAVVETAPVPAEKPKSAFVPTPKKIDQRVVIANEFRASKNLKTFYEKYSAPEYANDGAAAYYRAKAAVECQNWESMTSEKFATTMLGADHKSNPAVQERLQAMKLHEGKCQGFPKLDGKESTKLFDQAAQLNDPAGVAAKLADIYRAGKRDEATSIAQQLLRNPNGDLAAGLIHYFGNREEPWVIGENGAVNRRDISEEAWRLAACNWGADCGPTSNGLQFTCITQGICQVASYDDYLQRFRFSPSDYQTIVQLANQITSAVATQNWTALGLTIRGNPGNGK